MKKNYCNTKCYIKTDKSGQIHHYHHSTCIVSLAINSAKKYDKDVCLCENCLEKIVIDYIAKN